MSNDYSYDSDAQFFPFFVLTITGIVTLPLTYSILRSPSDSTATTSKAQHITSSFEPKNADLILAQRSKEKRKELRLKRILTVAAGWLLMAYMAYLMAVTSRIAPDIWNPYEILKVDMSATEKAINSRYRKLSTTMHPDKRKPNAQLNETVESVNDEWVEIVKAYKALTDEEIRNNFLLYGNPDGKQETSIGIALPKILVADGNGKYVLAFYGLLLGIGLPWFVGKWWYGSQKTTKEKIMVASAGDMFKEYDELSDPADIVAAISAASEFQEILRGGKAEAGLAKLESRILAGDFSARDSHKRKLRALDDPVRRKALSLIWAYLTRQELDDRALEAEKYEVAPTAVKLNEAFLSFCLAYGWTFPTLSCYLLSQCLTQAVRPLERLPLLQLPHFTPEIIDNIETKVPHSRKDHLSVQNFMALPAEQRQTLAKAAGLSAANLKVAEKVAQQLPRLQVERAFFKVANEKFITPGSLVSFVVKARIIPPGSTNVPAVKDADLQDIDPAEGDLKAQKIEEEEHPLPLAHAPYYPRDKSPKYSVFLVDARQGKIAVPPFTFGTFNKKTFEEQADGTLTPTYNVITLKMQFQAPPQVGDYKFQMQVMSDSYLGFDSKMDAVLTIDDPSKLQLVDEEDDISEPEEDSIAGQMAALKGDAPVKKPRKVKAAELNESDYESGTDEDELSESETDTETDTDGE